MCNNPSLNQTSSSHPDSSSAAAAVPAFLGWSSQNRHRTNVLPLIQIQLETGSLMYTLLGLHKQHYHVAEEGVEAHTPAGGGGCRCCCDGTGTAAGCCLRWKLLRSDARLMSLLGPADGACSCTCCRAACDPLASVSVAALSAASAVAVCFSSPSMSLVMGSSMTMWPAATLSSLARLLLAMCVLVSSPAGHVTEQLEAGGAGCDQQQGAPGVTSSRGCRV
jgi:hypothetical protein